MRWILLLLSISFSSFVFGQPTTGCCKRNQSAKDIIPKETISTSCLLCKSFQIKRFESFSKKDENKGGVQSNKKLSNSHRKILKTCQKYQRSFIEKNILVISKYNSLQSTEIDSMDQLLTDLELNLGMNLFEGVEEILTSSEIEMQCSKDEKIKTKIEKSIGKYKEIISSIVDIKSHHDFFGALVCPGYKVSKEEQRYLDQIKQIDELAKSALYK